MSHYPWWMHPPYPDDDFRDVDAEAESHDEAFAEGAPADLDELEDFAWPASAAIDDSPGAG